MGMYALNGRMKEPASLRWQVVDDVFCGKTGVWVSSLGRIDGVGAK